MQAESAAAQEGLLTEDIVIEFNGEPIRNMLEMQAALEKATAGKPVEVVVLRVDEHGVLGRQVITLVYARPLGIYAMPI